MKVVRLAKVLFAAYAASVGIAIAGIFVGSLLFGLERVDEAIETYLIPVVIAIAIILIPVMHKKLE